MAMYDNLLANVPTDLWIGGKWRKSSDGGRFDVIDPATENKVASVASATVDDAMAALDAASGAFAAWAGKKPRERAEVLRKSYELIMRDAERLAKLITIENGKALSDSRGEVAYAAEFFRWYAEEAVRNIGQNSVAPSSGARRRLHGGAQAGIRHAVDDVGADADSRRGRCARRRRQRHPVALIRQGRQRHAARCTRARGFVYRLDRGRSQAPA